MFLVQSHVDLPSIFGGKANVTLSRLVSRANYAYFACGTFRYSSIYDITRDHGFVNVSGPEQGYTKIFYSSIKVRII